jgi:FkbM family methyltransferase
MWKSCLRAAVPRLARNWVTSPKASLGWLADEVSYLAGKRHVVEMRPGWQLKCHPAAYRLAYQFQNTDPEQVAELDGFIRACHPGMAVFDIGAHFGLFSLAALHYGGNRARAFAIDPSPMAAKMTALHAGLNNCADRLTVLRKAVTDSTDFHPLVAAGIRAAGYFVTPSKHHHGRDLTFVAATTIDTLVELLGVRPTHIKIDVEGDEAAVIRGGRHTLSGATGPLLFVELHHALIAQHGGDQREPLRLLEEFGYAVHPINGPASDDPSIGNAPLVRVAARKTSQMEARRA